MKTLERPSSLKKKPQIRHKAKTVHREFLVPAPMIIPREDVEAGNIDPLLKQLKFLGILDPAKADINTVTWLRSQIAISIDGYSFDERELFHIPEVRSFWQKFHDAWPHGLYFFKTEGGTLLNLFMSHMETGIEREAGSNKILITAPDQESVKAFLVSVAGSAFIQVTRRLGWSPSDLSEFLMHLTANLSPIPNQLTEFKMKLALMMHRPQTDPFHPIPMIGQVNDVESPLAEGSAVSSETAESQTARQLAFLKSRYAAFASIAWLHFLHGGRVAVVFTRKVTNSPTVQYAVEIRNYANLFQDPVLSEYKELIGCVAKYNPLTHFVACISEPNSTCCVELGMSELPPPVAYEDGLVAMDDADEEAEEPLI
jgi:hypothetical protein